MGDSLYSNSLCGPPGGVSMGVRWVQRSGVMGDGEAVNSGGGPQRAGTASVLFMKLQPRPGSRLPGVMEGGLLPCTWE